MNRPRLLPLPAAQWDAETRQLLDRALTAPDGGTLNLFGTLARAPRLLKKWLVFASYLLTRGELSPADRELVILRTAWNCGCEYEWGQHVLLARRAGLQDDEIARVVHGPAAPDWSPRQAMLLRAADELRHSCTISAPTWAALAEQLTEQQLIELPVLIGQYHLVAFLLRSLAIAREPGVPGFPTSPAAP
jgi:AhpD family alkylhydroperoxidase